MTSSVQRVGDRPHTRYRSLSNSDAILEFLENSQPGRFCDDCTSKKAGVEPRQQVNQICNRLFTHGTLVRGEGSCTACGRNKITNAPASSGSSAMVPSHKPPMPPSPHPSTVGEDIDIEKIRTQIVHICQEVSKQVKLDSPLPRGIAGIINVLKDEKLVPRHQANMMLTLCGLRNVYVWDGVR